MVKRNNFLSRVNGATNAVRFQNRYSGEHLLVGKGAGSLETGSAVVADIVFIAKNGKNAIDGGPTQKPTLGNLAELDFPYTIIFDTEDMPGITGLVATAIGDQGINIDTVGHNLHGKDTAVFCVETMPCHRSKIDKAIQQMKDRRPGIFRTEPKVYPVLY
jgi:homoserine dehydrogenase